MLSVMLFFNMSFWGNPAKEYQPPEDGAAPDPQG